MPRGILLLIVFVLLLVGAAVYLSGQAREVPTRTIEVDVTANVAAR